VGYRGRGQILKEKKTKKKTRKRWNYTRRVTADSPRDTKVCHLDQFAPDVPPNVFIHTRLVLSGIG
jgi:hypothetical protein